jgi:hypothetical protein
MSDSSINPGKAYASNPQGRFGTFASNVAASDPTTVGAGASVSIDPGRPVTFQFPQPGPGNLQPPITIFLANATGGSTTQDKAAANVAGIAVTAGEAPGNATYFAGPGPVTLPIANWNAVVGGSTGLTTGARYYLGLTPGTLTTTEPTDDSNFATPVGYAMSPTTLFVQIGLAVGPLT